MNLTGKINEKGSLFIKRGNELKDIYCLEDTTTPGRRCGDWCPQFGEPFPTPGSSSDTIEIKICQGRTLYFDKLEDER